MMIPLAGYAPPRTVIVHTTATDNQRYSNIITENERTLRELVDRSAENGVAWFATATGDIGVSREELKSQLERRGGGTIHVPMIQH